MISKNLKYYRLRKNMTKSKLAELCGISPMSVTYYENGDRNPSMEILKKMASALDIRVSDFLITRNENLTFKHAEFRKSASLTQSQQEYIRESVEEYFNRFFTSVELLGGEVLPPAPVCHTLQLNKDDIEKSALLLRQHLKFANNGPIGNLIEALENKGILVYLSDVDNDKFSGMNGFVNNRPYIIVNANMSPERNRSTIAHELAHLMFDWSSDISDKEIEDIATSISGAFLFPADDARRELGIHRSVISNDMKLICREYGISMLMLVKRAELCGIVSTTVAKDFFIRASQHGWRKNEPSRIEPEYPTLFEQLVYRAVNEDGISIQRGAELLNSSYAEVEKRCSLEV